MNLKRISNEGCHDEMVAVAKWLRRLPVEQVRAGSNPVSHPKGKLYEPNRNI